MRLILELFVENIESLVELYFMRNFEFNARNRVVNRMFQLKGSVTLGLEEMKHLLEYHRLKDLIVRNKLNLGLKQY